MVNCMVSKFRKPCVSKRFFNLSFNSYLCSLMKKIMIIIVLICVFVWLFPIWQNVLLAAIYLSYKFKGLYNRWKYRKKVAEKEEGEIFPWEDVGKCLNKPFIVQGKKKCPKCGRLSYRLCWIYFTSPSHTWEDLCGRSGPLSLCPKCKKQVEFICQYMN